MAVRISFDKQLIHAFCRKWKVTEFAFFGSVLRDDFGTDSDVDVLISFDLDAKWSLYDLVDLQDELKDLFGRDVHVVEKAGLRNPYRRYAILKSREIIYAA